MTTAQPGQEQRMVTDAIIDEDALMMQMLNELHSNMPELDRPLSLSDLSDEQTVRARKAVRAVLLGAMLSKPAGHHPNLRAAEAATARPTADLGEDGELDARLRRTRPDEPLGDVPELLVNPDGPEAADRLILYREALAPFAREAEDWPDKMDCESLPAEATDIKISDLRRARAVLSRSGG